METTTEKYEGLTPVPRTFFLEAAPGSDNADYVIDADKLRRVFTDCLQRELLKDDATNPWDLARKLAEQEPFASVVEHSIEAYISTFESAIDSTSA